MASKLVNILKNTGKALVPLVLSTIVYSASGCQNPIIHRREYPTAQVNNSNYVPGDWTVVPFAIAKACESLPQVQAYRAEEARKKQSDSPRKNKVFDEFCGKLAEQAGKTIHERGLYHLDKANKEESESLIHYGALLPQELATIIAASEVIEAQKQKRQAQSQKKPVEIDYTQGPELE